ncbi:MULTISPECIES: hypothetical protein [Myroides]|uniref:Uncharacterized protein n=1 Tax=Myroides albus TaxID=2562892 RepID=A0A6I3LF87_9FLAO|nr:MULTISPECIES: hypothetical protein [Myroides]MTG96557.1 hypothetical protein [Myroides albus]MVX34553.1 hypothetical protein [Myroides sp. LoEW2-1]UVD81029.1 hypothetical protein NWE55_07215 [Myroides albus]
MEREFRLDVVLEEESLDFTTIVNQITNAFDIELTVKNHKGRLLGKGVWDERYSFQLEDKYDDLFGDHDLFFEMGIKFSATVDDCITIQQKVLRRLDEYNIAWNRVMLIKY